MTDEIPIWERPVDRKGFVAIGALAGSLRQAAARFASDGVRAPAATSSITTGPRT